MGLVRLRHVRGLGGEAPLTVLGMTGDPLALVHHLDGGGGNAQIQSMTDQGMGDAVEALVYLGVIIDAGFGATPLGVFVILRRQRLERGPVHSFIEILSALAAPLGGALVQLRPQLGDGGVQLGQREGGSRLLPPTALVHPCTSRSDVAIGQGSCARPPAPPPLVRVNPVRQRLGPGGLGIGSWGRQAPRRRPGHGGSRRSGERCKRPFPTAISPYWII